MIKVVGITALLAMSLLLSGCPAGTTGDDGGGIVTPPDTREPVLILDIPVRAGTSRKHIANVELWQDDFVKARVVVEAVVWLQNINISLDLPECLRPRFVYTGGLAVWADVALTPGEYFWEVPLVFIRDVPCEINGTLLYNISSQFFGDEASVPFEWKKEQPILR